ncbi:MAG: hypothetical protein HZC55_04090 [Verrucomicrobia bacterium]|nr:hypothetical protein [Verrucomicrobiota bacterium]
MATLPTIFRGENLLVRRSLLMADGVTPLPLSSLSSLRVQLFQGALEKASATLGTHPELRQGPGGVAEVEYELTSAVSAALTKGTPLRLRWTFRVPDAGFTVEPGAVFIDMIEEEIAFVAT